MPAPDVPSGVASDAASDEASGGSPEVTSGGSPEAMSEVASGTSSEVTSGASSEAVPGTSSGRGTSGAVGAPARSKVPGGSGAPGGSEVAGRSGGSGKARTYGPRERMVFSAAQLIRRDGVASTGMREVAAHAQAPRGSLQHYFPGGKEQLVNEAVAWAGQYAGRRVARFVAGMEAPTPSGLLAAMVGQWTDEYESAGFGAGCPVAAATVDCADSTDSTRAATAAAFATWSAPLAEALTGMGVPAAQSPSLATLMISTLEGALLIARAEQDVRALRTVARELGPMLDACVAARP